MRILQIPFGAVTCELDNAVIWFGENRILYSRPLPRPYKKQTRQEMLEEAVKFKEFVGHQPVCILAETHPEAESPEKEDREFIADQLAAVTRALAILTPSALSRMVANLFFLFQPPPYPTKFFLDESSAREWLKKVCPSAQDVQSTR